MNSKLKRFISSGAICLLALSASAANASLITWTLQDVQFDDRATASGWFSIESTNGIVQSWDITTTAGALLPGFHFDTSSSSLLGHNFWNANPNSFLFVRNSPFAQPYFNLSFVSSLTSPGTVDFDTSGILAGSWECNNCSNRRNVIDGSVVSSGNVPEPDALALLAIGLLGLGAAQRKKASSR